MYNSFNMYEILALVGYNTGKLKANSGGYYDCPLCKGRKKFNVNPSIGIGGVCRCVRCNAGGDKLDLYMYANHLNGPLVTALSKKGVPYQKLSESDRSDSLSRIIEDLHLKRQDGSFVSKTAEVEKRIDEVAERMSNTFRSPEELNTVYSAFLDSLSLSKIHFGKLIERGLLPEDIERIKFRTTPSFKRVLIAQNLKSQGLDLNGIPGFFRFDELDTYTGELQEKWSIYCPDEGYFVPICDKDGNIVSLQIRLNKPTTSKNKFRFFTSAKDELDSGMKADGRTHIEMCEDEPKYIYFVEGAIKAYVARSLYKQLYNEDNILFVAIPGTSNLSEVSSIMEWAGQFSLERVVEWYDRDKYTNEHVATARNNIERMLKEGIMKWKDSPANAESVAAGTFSFTGFTSVKEEVYKGKGIDDHLLVIRNERK